MPDVRIKSAVERFLTAAKRFFRFLTNPKSYKRGVKLVIFDAIYGTHRRAGFALNKVTDALRRSIPDVESEDSLDSVFHIQSLMEEAVTQIEMDEAALEELILAVVAFAAVELSDDLLAEAQFQYLEMDGEQSLASWLRAMRRSRADFMEAARRHLQDLPSFQKIEEDTEKQEAMHSKLILGLLAALTKKAKGDG